MGLPTTLAGIMGFFIFIVLILGLGTPDLYPDETQKIRDNQEQFRSQFNQTTNRSTSPPSFWGSLFGIVGLDGIYNFIIGFFSMLMSFVILIVDYFLMFFGIAGSLPYEFYILFALLGSSLIIGIVKLIFLSGD